MSFCFCSTVIAKPHSPHKNRFLSWKFKVVDQLCSHNLMPNKGEDMYMSINSEIRKHAKAADGDFLDVTLYLDS